MIDLAKYKMKKFCEYTLEELRELNKETSRNRQHGRIGTENLNPEEEKTRLYNNLASRVSRAKRTTNTKATQDIYTTILSGMDTIPDKLGITQKDERRYKNCFNCGYIGLPVDLEYVKTMTGLDDTQIYVLQKRTGLLPYPSIKKPKDVLVK